MVGPLIQCTQLYQGWFWPGEKLATKRSAHECGGGWNFGGGLLQAPVWSAGARVNVGVQGAEPPEAVTIFAFERHLLGCQNSTPHIRAYMFFT